jgi:hypothetical protein
MKELRKTLLACIDDYFSAFPEQGARFRGMSSILMRLCLLFFL